MGKATLAHAISMEMGVNLKIVSGSAVRREGDLAALLTNLNAGDILLISDCDDLPADITRILGEVLGTFDLQLMIGRGRDAKRLRLRLPKFTFIGTTSRPASIDRRILRWVVSYDFKPYSLREMATIVTLLAARQGYRAHPESGRVIAPYCKGNPADAEAIVRRLGPAIEDIENAKEALDDLGYGRDRISSTDLASYISELSGDQFEQLVKRIYFHLGYQTEVVGQSGDHGIDLLAQREGEVIAIQCKRWSNPVGEPIVRDFYGALMHSKAERGQIIAADEFTEAAKSFAEGKPIQLVDIHALLEVINRNDLEHLVNTDPTNPD